MKVIAGTARSMGVEVESMSAHGKRYKARARADRPREPLLAGEAIRLLKGLETREVRRDRRGPLPARSQRPPRRRAAARDADAPARHRPRSSASPSSPRATRPTRPRRPAQTSSAPPTSRRKIEDGFTDFDVAIATPDQMGNVGKLGRVLGPARPDAEPEDRHGHVRRRQGRLATQRPASSSTAPTAARTSTSDRQEELRRAPARRELRGADRRDHPREARR